MIPKPRETDAVVIGILGEPFSTRMHETEAKNRIIQPYKVLLLNIKQRCGSSRCHGRYLPFKSVQSAIWRNVQPLSYPAEVGWVTLNPSLVWLTRSEESTTIALLAKLSGLLEPLRAFVKMKPVWGTCAGAILLSQAVDNSTAKRGGQELLGGMSITISRNGWGSQVCISVPLHYKVPTSFIRSSRSKRRFK